jgi:hypothetical protein
LDALLSFILHPLQVYLSSFTPCKEEQWAATLMFCTISGTALLGGSEGFLVCPAEPVEFCGAGGASGRRSLCGELGQRTPEVPEQAPREVLETEASRRHFASV